MKLSIPLCLFLAVGGVSTLQYSEAAPVVEDAIPQNIDWFVHMDADQFRSTKTGSALINELTAIAQEEAGQEMPINPVLVINGLSGLTLFGTMPDMENPENLDAVVVLDGAPELLQILKGMVSGMKIEKPDMLIETQVGAHNLMTLKDGGIHGTFIGDTGFALSKSLTSIEDYLAVRDGKKQHIALSERFPMASYDANSGLFFGAYIEGMKEVQALPVQARILKMTESVALQLGESGEYVNLMTSLTTDSETTSQQVAEVLKGIIAVFALTQANEDLAALVQQARVESVGSSVALTLNYPVEAAEKWIKVAGEKARVEIAAKKAAEAARAAEEAAQAAEKAAAEAAEAAAAAETAPAG
ncbi:MAG: hypothetical protein AB3N63_16915 [Puniceicoccaceae bacterium]